MRSYSSVGVGFGPANIAVAIALNEGFDKSCVESHRHIFFDSREEPSWHPGLLFDVSTMQISFLKDLVTMVNPTSEFTFLNYLKERDRMHEFINLRTFYPRRIEFDDYLRWASDKLSDFSRFNHEITEINLEDENNVESTGLIVTVKDKKSGREENVIADNIIVSDGGIPKWPRDIDQITANRIFHGSETLGKLEKYDLSREGDYIFHVVGSGQSSADIMDYLGDQYPNSRIILTHRSFSMRPEDDSHFVNELFMPDAVSMFQEMSQDARDSVIKDCWHTTHSGVTLDLLPKLYEKIYYDKARGRNRYSFNRFSEITGSYEVDNRTFTKIRNIHTGDIEEIDADFTILATGYQRPCPHPLLKSFDHLLGKIKDQTAYEINHNYRVKTKTETGFNIYMQGYAERTHGFSETLLSLMPERAAKIAAELVSTDNQSIKLVV